ncbi:hypothetical protein [Rathayibacter sp. SD072]|uniref:hypothetical protein n=1 Tax=Rathayibacter sp. SD072 TaxID=2781731 RepID=UPI001F621CC0|nr:hypothetical protein [Rathayibacter sp. SD072]
MKAQAAPLQRPVAPWLAFGLGNRLGALAWTERELQRDRFVASGTRQGSQQGARGGNDDGGVQRAEGTSFEGQPSGGIGCVVSVRVVAGMQTRQVRAKRVEHSAEVMRIAPEPPAELMVCAAGFHRDEGAATQRADSGERSRHLAFS